MSKRADGPANPYAAKPISVLFSDQVYHKLLYFSSTSHLTPEDFIKQAVQIHCHRKELAELGQGKSLMDRWEDLKTRKWLPDIGIKRTDLPK